MIVRMLRHGTRVERAMSGNSKFSGRTNPGAYKDKEKPHEVRVSNITAAKGWYSLCLVLARATVTGTSPERLMPIFF